MANKPKGVGQRRKRLSDLGRTGKPGKVVWTDAETGEKTTTRVWIEKLSPSDYQKCVNRANAARARILAIARGDIADDENEMPTREVILQQVIDMGDDPAPLVAYLAQAKVQERYHLIDAELRGDEDQEWGKEGYLVGLIDAWNGVDEADTPLKEIYAHAEAGDTSLDPALVAQARHIFSEMTRYDEAFAKAIADELVSATDYYETESLDSVRSSLTDQFIKEMGDAEWSRVFVLSRILYMVRVFEQRNQNEFDSFAELEGTDDRIIAQLIRQIDALTIPDAEVKGSRRPRSSSPLTGQSGGEGASTSSGPDDDVDADGAEDDETADA